MGRGWGGLYAGVPGAARLRRLKGGVGNCQHPRNGPTPNSGSVHGQPAQSPGDCVVVAMHARAAHGHVMDRSQNYSGVLDKTLDFLDAAPALMKRTVPIALGVLCVVTAPLPPKLIAARDQGKVIWLLERRDSSLSPSYARQPPGLHLAPCGYHSVA